MALNFTADAQAALDLAKRSVPKGGELDAGLLLAALYHATPLKQRLPESVARYLAAPQPHTREVPEKIPVGKALQPVLTRFASDGAAVTPEELFRALIEDDDGRQALHARGMAEEELGELVRSFGSAAEPEARPGAGAGTWRRSPERQLVLEKLSSYGRVLTLSEPPYRGVYGMEPTVRALVRTLSRMRNRSAIVLGHSGTGKSAVVYEFARRVYRGEQSIPEHLRDADIFELSPSFLRSGAKMVGQYDERVKELIQLLEPHPKVILFVDEIHAFLKSGMHERDPFTDANESFKGKLASGDIACIGCTTYSEYRHYIEPDAALARRFTVVRLEPPTAEATVKILEARRPKMEEYFAPLRIPDAAVQRAVELTEQYLPSRFQPAKSIQLLDEACAHCVTSKPRPAEVTDDALWTALEDVIGHSIVRAQRITERELYQRLRAKIVGQDQTLAGISRAFLAGLGDWSRGSRPRGVWFFCGPTGVGKTEVSLLLAGILGGGKDALVRIDCNNLQGSGHDSGPAINTLLGAPPGYVGYVLGQGGLLSRVRDTPECIVLFDEIEKADPGVSKLLLQVMDVGKVEDNDGNALDFRRAFVVFTSNAGAVYGSTRGMGFVQTESEDRDAPQPVDIEAVKNALRGRGYGEEFFGRIDHFFVFEGLKPDAVREIIGTQLDGLHELAEVKGYRLEWEPSLVEHLATGWQPRFGARFLITILRHRIVEQLSVAQAQGELEGVKGIRLRARPGAAAAAGADLTGLANRERAGDVLTIYLM